MSHDHPIRHSYFMNPTKKAYKHEKYFNKAFLRVNTMKAGNSTILAHFLQIVIVSHGYITLINFRVKLQLMTSTQKNYHTPNNIEIFASQISKHSNAPTCLIICSLTTAWCSGERYSWSDKARNWKIWTHKMSLKSIIFYNTILQAIKLRSK